MKHNINFKLTIVTGNLPLDGRHAERILEEQIDI